MADWGPSGRITLKQYMQSRDERLRLDELEENAFYALHLRLAKSVLEAVRMAASARAATNMGSKAIELCILDDDLIKPVATVLGHMDDGLWRGPLDKPLVMRYQGQGWRAQEGYFLDYDEGLDMPTVEAAQSEHLPKDLSNI